jgi:hypothetical protein
VDANGVTTARETYRITPSTPTAVAPPCSNAYSATATA